jgi:hypothetical protein
MIDKKHIGYAPPPILWDVEKGRIAFFAKVIGLTGPDPHRRGGSQGGRLPRHRRAADLHLRRAGRLG